MKKFLYLVTTVSLGLVLHLLFFRYISVWGVSPHLLLLLVVAHGFLMGPLMGETLGFALGLLVDAIGVSFFGLQTLLFSVAGYVAGKLSKRVAIERPAAQLAIGGAASAYYFLFSSFVRNALDPVGQIISIPKILLASTFNVLIAVGVFWAVAFWLKVWSYQTELS